MINYVYQLVAPKTISIKYEDVSISDKLVIKPKYMALCHADQRYYWGMRERAVLKKKLPMALIHECCGEVVYDPTGTYPTGEPVVMIPNVPGEDDPVVLENYRKDSGFLSSGKDGFMREYVELPLDRVVSHRNIPARIATVAEFISVAVHSVARFSKVAHEKKDVVGIWGDGSLSFVVANVLRKTFPESKVVVIGRNVQKLSYFSFATQTYLTEELPDDFEVDHAFECCGGEGSYYAIDDIIRYINPQGTVMLMGVSENRVGINTRDILEKGLLFLGSSRSGRTDFEAAVKLLQDSRVQRRMSTIIYEAAPVKSIADIHRVFSDDMNTDFKTVFKWEL